MDIPIIHPAAMKPGDLIEIVAPAGPIEQRDDMMKGVASLERMGFRVRFHEAIFSSTGYLAGPDEVRASGLMRALRDPEVKAVISLRGGYGCARLIPLLQPELLENQAKIFMGFSDLTTLHLYFRRRLGWKTLHGPMATSPTLSNIGSAQEMHLVRLWTDPGYHASLSFPELETWAAGAAEGELVGGCLSLLTASLGTPYEMDTDGKVLFLEDLGEPPYRLDRMLTQLRLAGKLERIAGVLLGEFKDCDSEGKPPSAEDTLRDFMTSLEVPVLAHFPSGHGSENWVLPLGSRIRLDATARTVNFLDSFTAAPAGFFS
jgi:muramoyltetrapeptide carboxypeptidase